MAIWLFDGQCIHIFFCFLDKYNNNLIHSTVKPPLSATRKNNWSFIQISRVSIDFDRVSQIAAALWLLE